MSLFIAVNKERVPQAYTLGLKAGDTLLPKLGSHDGSLLLLLLLLFLLTPSCVSVCQWLHHALSYS